MAYFLMHLNLVLVLVLFGVYLALWKVKEEELKRQAGVDVRFIYRAVRPVQKYFGQMARVLMVLLVVILGSLFFLQGRTPLTTPLFGAGQSLFLWGGFALGLAGLGLCRLAQVTIGRSWRVGIDEGTRPGLITNGIYRLIRNPTYTGLYMLVAGVLLMLPVVVLSWWALAFVLLMEFQVRCEEEFLETQYGQEYLEYMKKTWRYVPFIY